ncbi:MAG: HIT family protein [Lentisphaeria bacterium]|nr:HIT family protein [Lentisphaeria bacterium]
MRNCIFCKIIAGEIPSVKLYEDDLVYAFMDIAPITFGHTLVIPKEHHTSVATIPEATAGRMFLVGSRLGVAMKRGLAADGFNLHLSDGTVAGQVVMHAHLHVVPRWTDDGFHWNWRQLKYENEAAREELKKKMLEYFRLTKDASEAEEPEA